MSDLINQRKEMLEQQLKKRGITDDTVLKAFDAIPRELFVTKADEQKAYCDSPQPIGYGQTISQPYIVAFMLELLAVKANDSILEIGTGSGYQTALLAKLGKKVYSIERIEQLQKCAEKILLKLSCNNIILKTGDGTTGWEQYAPFDKIIVSAGTPSVPPPLIQQLALGGILVVPVGNYQVQYLVRYTKHPQGIKEERFIGCVFVPLIGSHGWTES